MSESGSNDEYGTYSTDDSDQLTGEDTLGDGSGSDVVDELDRGYSPPESWSAAEGYGNTPYEEAVGESFEQRLAQEVPDPTATSIDALDELPGESVLLEDEDLADHEVGDRRAGRLVAPADGPDGDIEQDLVATDVGIDGAAASAEEAAVHVIPDADAVFDDSVPSDAVIEELLGRGDQGSTEDRS